MKRDRFFKITSAETKPIVVFSRHGWSGLIALCDKITERDKVFIRPISAFEFIRYIVRGVCRK